MVPAEAGAENVTLCDTNGSSLPEQVFGDNDDDLDIPDFLK